MSVHKIGSLTNTYKQINTVYIHILYNKTVLNVNKC